jgi:pyruvate kinase
MLRRSKIVATIGPATDSPEMVEELIRAGLDVARLNFSHGDHASHRKNIELLRAKAALVGRTVGILQDLAGPKIRMGELKHGEMELSTGQEVVFCSGAKSDDERIPVNYPYLTEDVAVDDRILVADGLVELIVVAKDSENITCRVLMGGTISSRKGVNLPISSLRIPSFTDKDKADLELGLECGVDFVALSFVRHEEDLAEVRERINYADNPPLLIAKIEKPQAVERLPQILAMVDGVMVARGDLGVEMRLEEVPLVQKRIIRMARREGKPVITATQMLRSMMENTRPTRAEANDVANAVLDGSDAVMLSDETAVGAYPVEAVKVMDRICHHTEPALQSEILLGDRGSSLVPAIEGNISRAACHLAQDLKARALVAGTSSGLSARLVSRFRPAMPVVALTYSKETKRQLSLSWGVIPILVPQCEHTDQLFAIAGEEMIRQGLAEPGERVVITAGLPLGIPGSTNLVRVLDLPEGG